MAKIQRRTSGADPGRAGVTKPWVDYCICLLLFFSTLAVYSQVRHYDFINYDDPEYVTENPDVRAGLTSHGLVWALTSTSAANWFPLTWLSHMMDCQLFGLRSGMHHLTNVVIHILASLLLFVVFNRMTGSHLRSAVVAFLFALHPLHVESVAWVAERKDVLSAFFCFLAVWGYVRYVEVPRPGRYLLIIVAFCCGIMSKPMVVTLPFLLLLLDVWPLGRIPISGQSQGSIPDDRSRSKHHKNPLAAIIWEKAPLFALSTAASVLTLMIQRRGGAVMSVDAMPIGARLENALISYVTYLAKTFWPTNLAVFYPYPTDLPGWQVATAGLVLLGITAAAVHSVRVRPYFAMGWFWFLGTLIPVIGLVQVGLQSRADRYTYIPSIGIFLVVVWGGAEACRRWRQRRIVGLALAAAGCCGSLVLTWYQVQHWKNSTSLFTHALEVTSGNCVVHTLLGTELVKEGRAEEGIVHLQEAVMINPEYPEALNNLGEALLEKGRNEDALRYLIQAVQLSPRVPQIHTNLGTIFLRLNRADDAIAELSKALRLQPDSPEAHCELGLVCEAQGRMDEALAQLGEAIRIRPDYADARYNLGRVLAATGRTDEAVAQFSEVVRISPEYVSAHYNLGTALASQGKLIEAVSEFETAVRLKPDYAAAHNNLGSALAGIGKYDEAIAHYKEALRINPTLDEARRNLEYALALKSESIR